MKNQIFRLILLLIFLSISNVSISQLRCIHVFVALCDNEHQGIIPVPQSLGDGKDPAGNLYWGAAYGLKSFLVHKTKEWELIKSITSENEIILERLLFKHQSQDVYLLADAYDGEFIDKSIEDFLLASNGQNGLKIMQNSFVLNFGGSANLLTYVGHDGLMDFSLDLDYKDEVDHVKDVIILACYSKRFFGSEIKRARANPLLWTTHLMAPEAYTLKAALDGWIINETPEQIHEHAARAYHNYQNCGIRGARNLFATGF